MSARHIVRHQSPLGTAAHLHKDCHVILVVTNTRRWRSRYELGNDAISHWRSQGTEPWVIECAFGERAHAITDAENPRHIRLRTEHEYWSKEALINLAVQRLPSDWKYVAWVDADVSFVRPDIVNETVQMLQHHRVVQMFSEAHDLGPDYQVIAKHESFAWSYLCRRPRRHFGQGGYYYTLPSGRPGHHLWHPGWAWACRRSAFDALGGLIDWAILGSADNHQAWAWVGEAYRSVHPKASPGYRKHLDKWQERAETHIRRDIGCVAGTMLHGWHGRKALRQYSKRWRILVEHQYDPTHHLKRDWQGLPQLVDRGDAASIGLRDGIRQYMTDRREDSTDI